MIQEITVYLTAAMETTFTPLKFYVSIVTLPSLKF